MLVTAGGRIAFVWDDQLQPLWACLSGKVPGCRDVVRVSHIEPGPGGWLADLSPIHGPTLGPFDLRGAALQAEHNWLTPRLLDLVTTDLRGMVGKTEH